LSPRTLQPIARPNAYEIFACTPLPMKHGNGRPCPQRADDLQCVTGAHALSSHQQHTSALPRPPYNIDHPSIESSPISDSPPAPAYGFLRTTHILRLVAIARRQRHLQLPPLSCSGHPAKLDMFLDRDFKIQERLLFDWISTSPPRAKFKKIKSAR
jgi:hypothetical protein